MEPEITWLGHASLMLAAGRTIIVDPWKINGNRKADVVAITHSHFDHCSPEDIARVLKEHGTVVGPADALEKLEVPQKHILKPGETLDLGWVKMKALPAYNLQKEFHPKANGWLGYVMSFNGFSVYIAGDTDHIPEMDNIEVDVAIVPVGGTYTMDAIQAAEAVNIMKPKVAIPVHFGDIVGAPSDGEKFASLVKDVEVRILRPVQN